MSLPNYLANIKSAGIYRFVWDKSQMPPQQAETLRLVVGYSEKGPFNTPVYIDDPTDFIKIFGNISKKLEKRGVYFHRLALQAIQGGPILALNLKKFLSDGSTFEQDEKEIAYDAVEYRNFTPVWNRELDNAEGFTDIKNVFDTNRFWTLEPNLLPVQVTTDLEKNKKKYVTLVSTDSKETSNTVIMRGYAPRGYDISFKTWYSNSGEEMPSYLEGYENMLVSDFFAEVYVFSGKFTSELATTEELKRYFSVTSDGQVYLNEYLTDAFGNKVDTLETLAADDNSGFIQKYRGIMLPYFKDLNGAYLSLDLLFNGDNDVHKMLMKFDDTMLDNGEDYEGNEFNVSKITSRGWDVLNVSDLTYIVNNQPAQVSYNCYLTNEGIVPTALIAKYVDDSDDSSDDTNKHWEYSPQTTFLYDPSLIIYEGNANLTNLPTHYLDLGWAEGDRFLVVKNGDLIVSTLSKYEVLYNDSEHPSTPTGLKVEFAAGQVTLPAVSVNGSSVSFVKCNHITTDNINMIDMGKCYVQGYTMNPKMVKPASSAQGDKLTWQKNILSVLTDAGMFEALTNNTDIEYRLLVDTFESFVDTELKSTLSYLTRKKDNALAILNAPAVSTFVNCEYTSFTDAEGFKMKYVVEGGNKRKPIGRLFTLPSEANGASWAAFYTPVAITDGTVKTMVPSAALVSNLFMEKYTMRHAYDIVAGPNYGRIIATGLVGPDFNYSRSDLDLLEPFGINCLVYVPRRGTLINSNQTAKQTPKSALSSVNVRELVIYLQDEIAYLLQSYQWELNTQPLRDTVKAKADTILDNVQGNGGVYAFRNTCDETNNTEDVIDNEMLVLSTEIEPGRGAGKMVEELTIYRKGGITSSAT